MKIAKVIQMKLKGQTLTLEVSDKLLQKVKDTYMLDSTEAVTERHVQYYIISSMKNTLDSGSQL